MPRRVTALAVAALVGLGAAGCGSDDSPTLDAGGDGDATTTTGAEAVPTTRVDDDSTSTTTTLAPQFRQIEVLLTGEQVAPSPTAVTAGTAEGFVTYDGDELCLEGTTTGVGAITGGHVHAGLVGEAGPVVVDLGIETAGDGPFSGCATVGAEGGVVVIDPTSYYVQLHTPDFPDGAVRAQLG